MRTASTILFNNWSFASAGRSLHAYEKIAVPMNKLRGLASFTFRGAVPRKLSTRSHMAT